MKKSAMKGILFLSIIFMSISLHGEIITGDQFFNGNFRDNNLTITRTKIGGWIGDGVPHNFESSSFNRHNTLNINISDKTFFKRDFQRGGLRIGTADVDRAKTLNITASGNINRLFDLDDSRINGNAYAAVISPRFVLDASGVRNNDFQAFNISTGNYSKPYSEWPVTASISFGSDVIVTGLDGTQKFAVVQDNDNNANASLWLNHRGAISADDYYKNYWGDNISINRQHVQAPVASDIFARRIPRTGLNNYQTTNLGKMLKISGDIVINGNSFVGARMYANFISDGNNTSHYYGDISGTGNIYANFIRADFKGNAVGNIGSSTGSISGNGIREVAFVFRDNVAAGNQFNLNVANNNPSNKWYIENANINGGAISTAGDVWNAFASTGINFNGRKDSNLTFAKSSIEVTSGTLTGSFTGYFGNKSHTTDWWGNAKNETYTKTYTLRKAGSSADANVSDANIGIDSDGLKKLVYFLYTKDTFEDANNTIKDFGYTGTILGGTPDSEYFFDNAGYIYQNQLNKAIGKITLSGNTKYADMVYGNNNAVVNIALDMGATNPNRGNGSVVGNAANRKVELDFTGITTHKDIFFNILGSGKGEYTISNLKNVSTSMKKGDRFDTTTIRKDLEYTDSILGVLGNAGVGVFTSRPATDPQNVTVATTDLNGISADSKFILRGTSISGNLRDGNYSYDFVFNSTPGYKGQSGLKKNIESSSYSGSEIDLSTNTRDQKLHFIGADSVTRNRLKLTLGAGAHDIAFVGLNTNGTTKTIELDANRSTGGTYMLNGVNIENSGANHILPARDANISINNATLTLSNMTGNQTAIDGQNNTLKSDLSGVNISLSTTGKATAIKLRDNSVNLSGKINLTSTTNAETTAIDYRATSGANTINITDTANINANYGIIANLNAGSMLNINNTGLLQTDIREIRLSGAGDVNLGVYHTKLRDFTTDITAFDPNDNNGLHSMEMTNTNSINFDKELIFTSMDTTESFYLQDMVTVDTNNTSAQWNPTATRIPGSVSASPDLKIYAPLDMFSMELDRGTGLVVVGVNPNLAPTTTFSKIILGTLESGGNKIESDVGNYLFNMSRGRYLTSTQQKVWKDKSRTQALRMAMRAKNENPNIPYNKVSTKFTKGDKKIDTANALEYLLYERHNRVEMFVEPYYIHSTLNDKDLSGKMSGYGLNGGMSINVIPQWILGWHVGLDTRSGTGRGAVSTRASTTSFVTLNTGIHTRLNLGHINQTRLVYLRGNALYQRTQAKQNTDLIGDSISLNNDATALKFDALLGMEQSTKSGDVVALELGVSKYDMTFSKESFKTGPNSEFVMDSVKKDMLYILANLRYARMYRNAMVFISPNISLGVKVLANEMNFSPELRFGAVSFVPEVSLNRFSGILDIGVDMITLGRSLTLGARYIGEYGQFMITHSVQGKVGYRF